MVVSTPTPGLFDDAQDRIIPALGDQGTGSELQAVLSELSVALRSDDTPKAQRSLSAARKFLARMETTEHPANVAAIRLALARVEALLSKPSDDQLPAP
jgi:hypothetical protein